jgi:hypothetical protein
MAETVWGQFEYDRGRELLRNVFSGQAIELGSESPERCVFTYRDAETQAAIVTERRPWGWTVDFNDMAVVKQSYGLWRRLAFGLLDALTFWFSGGRSAFEVGRVHQITLEGGWQNGRWARSSRITANAGGYPYDPNAPLNPPTPKKGLELFPLDGRPSTWRYVDVQDIALETKLATFPGRALPVLDRSVSLDVQLARAPRFVRDDGRAVLFHRYVAVNFHRGEDYDPTPYYGYVNEHVALTLDTYSSYGVWHFSNPILASEWVLPKAHFDDLQVLSKDVTRTTPALGLREELFFALFDICAVRQEAAMAGRLPILRERDHETLGSHPDADGGWNGIPFGQYLDKMAWLPMQSPLGMASTSFSAVLPTSFDAAQRRRGVRMMPDWLRGVFRGGRR